MKKVIYFGNFFGNNGPAIVNRKIRDELNKDTYSIIFMDDYNKKELIKKLIFNFWTCDAIHVSGINGIFSAISVIVARLFFKKVYFSCHGSVLNESKKNNKKNKIYKLIEYIYVKFSNNIIVLSNIFLTEYSKTYKDIYKKSIIIPNGYDFDKKLYEKYKNKDFNETFIITSLGGGRREKGNLQVCKALNELNYNNILYNIVGEDGIDTEAIKTYSFVNYLGIKSQEDVKNVLINSHLFVQYSDLESFGIAPIEAMNCGCDILISNKMGVCEYLEEERDKYIVDNSDLNELKSKLISKIRNRNNVPSIKCISWNEVSKKYIDIWEGKSNV